MLIPMFVLCVFVAVFLCVVLFCVVFCAVVCYCVFVCCHSCFDIVFCVCVFLCFVSNYSGQMMKVSHALCGNSRKLGRAWCPNPITFTVPSPPSPIFEQAVGHTIHAQCGTANTTTRIQQTVSHVMQSGNLARVALYLCVLFL